MTHGIMCREGYPDISDADSSYIGNFDAMPLGLVEIPVHVLAYASIPPIPAGLWSDIRCVPQGRAISRDVCKGDQGST